MVKDLDAQVIRPRDEVAAPRNRGHGALARVNHIVSKSKPQEAFAVDDKLLVEPARGKSLERAVVCVAGQGHGLDRPLVGEARELLRKEVGDHHGAVVGGARHKVARVVHREVVHRTRVAVKLHDLVACATPAGPPASQSTRAYFFFKQKRDMETEHAALG